ncbi:MAG: chromosomal replication initiator protein DnaA [Proteobacteria bacterium]|nr:chromosomal replication initiator protein DnaA [Pseudomonadota bacterium]MBW3617632.1 chromosomal replication initiator protein DnaA [Pseudomonadota bacterium]
MTATREITAAPGEVWARASAALRQELGENAFASWLAQAAVLEGRDGRVALVAPTGFARDWIRRNASRRVAELWAANDPLNRPLDLKCRAEVDAAACAVLESAAEPAPSTPLVAQAPVQAVRGRASGLQDRWTFDSFVSGPSNEFAHSVARTVASWADGHFNPVVIHGPYGFGKTHLLNAMALEAQRTQPGKTVLYMTSERFLSGFVRAVMDRSTAGFKEELRSADLLLIDDVHFIAGKPSSQEELLQTLSALMEDGKRVVLASDRPPAALAEMEPRLRSHLQAGLVCGIEPADRTLRVGIIERKLHQLARQRGMDGIKGRPEVLQFVADRFSESVRELEGALNTLFARAEARLPTLSLDEAQAILRPHLKGAERRVTVDEIQKLVAEHFGLKQADLLSERRTRAVARPRQIAMHLAKSLTTKSYPDIGRRFGGRDHTTVLHAVRTIERMITEDPAMARDVETLGRKLRG